jgi:hypothetical protein
VKKRKMKQHSSAQLLFFAVSSLALLFLVFAPNVSVAATNPTPNGFVGGCNMVVSWPGVSHTGVPTTFFPNDFQGPGAGMARAMSVNPIGDTANGNANSQAEIMGGCPPTG